MTICYYSWSIVNIYEIFAAGNNNNNESIHWIWILLGKIEPEKKFKHRTFLFIFRVLCINIFMMSLRSSQIIFYSWAHRGWLTIVMLAHSGLMILFFGMHKYLKMVLKIISLHTPLSQHAENLWIYINVNSLFLECDITIELCRFVDLAIVEKQQFKLIA